MLQGKFRWKPILALSLLFVTVAVGWFFLHRLQMRSIHGHYRELAARDEESGRYDRAARFLRLYILAHGEDAESLARYGIMLEDKLPATSRAHVLSIYEQALKLDGFNLDIRLRAAKLCIARGEFDKALKHLEVLQKSNPEDPEVNLLQGDCKDARREPDKAKRLAQWNEAEAHYRTAIRRAPGKLDGYVRLAAFLRKQQRNSFEAAQVLEDLVRANPKESGAYLVRASFRQTADPQRIEHPAASAAETLGLLSVTTGDGPLEATLAMIRPRLERDLVGAGQDLAVARQLAPKDIVVLLSSAQHEMLRAREQSTPKSTEHLDQGRSYLKLAGELHPNDLRVPAQLAALEVAAGKRKEAINLLRAAQLKSSGKERNRLLWDLAVLLIDEDILTDADEVIGQLKKVGEPPYRLSFLQGKRSIKKGEWDQAKILLEAARPMLVDSPALTLQTDLLLAMCFDQMGNLDQQLAMYQRAKTVDPLNPISRAGLAKTLSAMGRLEEAIQESRILAGAELFHARLLIHQNLRRAPFEAPNWNEVQETLDAAGKNSETRSMDVKLLAAELAYARAVAAERLGKSHEAQAGYDKARRMLEKTREESPKSIDAWLGLAALAARKRDEAGIAEALQVLDKTRAALGDRPEWRLAMLRFVPDKKEKATAFLQPLAENLDRFESADQARLLNALADAYEQAGDLAAAERSWTKLSQLEPRRLGVHLALFDFYFRTENVDGMEKALATIKTIEGPGGPNGHFGKAQILIFHAGRRQREAGDAARPLNPDEEKWCASAKRELEAARSSRPRWSRVYVSLARVAELERVPDLAIARLREAVDLGNRQTPVIRSLVEMLMARNAVMDAEEILRKLQDTEGASDPFLQMRAAEISLLNQNSVRALELTRSAIARDSRNPLDHLWQGEMLGAIGKKDDAESALRTAIKLAADDPRPWVALVKLHVRFGNPARAREILTEMKGSIPQSKLSLAMAHCHQILGETAEAEKAYEDALAKHGGDFDMQEAIVHGLVTLHQRTGNASKSEAPLRQILAPGTKASEGMQAWARRNLAAALMFQEGDAKKAEAMQLIGQNLKANPTRAEDLFIQGVLYSHKKSTLEEGIKILERAFRVKPPTADQKFVLVNMYESKGDMQRARDLMSNLVSLHANDEKHPRYVAIYIDKLIQEGKEHKAREWLERLVEVACTDHVDHQRLALAASMLTDLLRRHPQLTREVLPQTKSIRLLASRSGKSGNLLSVAELLGQTGQLELALNLCDDVFKTIPSVQVIDVAVTALSINAATAKDFQRVEGWLEAARKRKPDEAEWDVRLGILKERQGAFAEAESLYRGVLKRDPKDLVAMNNLAFLVGLRGKGNDAHALIQDLIDRIGPAGELLDTRASIRLAQGKFIEAERDLRDAMKLENTAYRQFHLAQVFHAAGKTSDASAEFRKARDLGLNPNMVHPLERASYQALEQLTQR